MYYIYYIYYYYYLFIIFIIIIITYLSHLIGYEYVFTPSVYMFKMLFLWPFFSYETHKVK
jgi:hypothetical protein